MTKEMIELEKIRKGSAKKRYQGFLILIGCFFLLGCPPPETVLMPQPTEEYTLVNTRRDADTAQIVSGEIILKISGGWRPDGSVGFNIDIQNNSDAPSRFDLYKIRLEDEAGQTARLTGISEIVEDKVQNNSSRDIGNRNKWVTLAENKQITYLPKQHRPVSGYFQFPSDNGFKIESGKKIRLIIPASVQIEKEIEIWFECVYD